MAESGGNHGIATEELRQFIERIEQLESERKETADLIREVFAEMKGRGFDTSAVRVILKERKADPDALAEQEAMIDLYRSALGMA